MIPHPTNLSVSSQSCCDMFVHVASSWGMMTFDEKIMQDPLFLAPVMANRILEKKVNCFSQISKTGTIEKTEECPESPRNSACPFSSVVHHKAVEGGKQSVPPYGCTVLHLTTVLYLSLIHI